MCQSNVSTRVPASLVMHRTQPVQPCTSNFSSLSICMLTHAEPPATKATTSVLSAVVSQMNVCARIMTNNIPMYLFFYKFGIPFPNNSVGLVCKGSLHITDECKVRTWDDHCPKLGDVPHLSRPGDEHSYPRFFLYHQVGVFYIRGWFRYDRYDRRIG